MTFGTLVTGVMVLGVDLFVPLGPGRIRFVTANTVSVVEHLHFHVRVVCVRPTETVANFAGKVFVPEVCNLLELFVVAFLTSSLSSERSWMACQFCKCLSAIPAVLTE